MKEKFCTFERLFEHLRGVSGRKFSAVEEQHKMLNKDKENGLESKIGWYILFSEKILT